jgi:uncharacterized membrane protein YgaE (UPF0421/DUF939 family)
MKMMSKTSSTSISGVTLIIGAGTALLFSLIYIPPKEKIALLDKRSMKRFPFSDPYNPR